MKKLGLFLSISSLILILASCDKEVDNDFTQPPNLLSNTDYLPANPANYWVFETYRVDSNGVETLLGRDTTRVSDTLINGISYKNYRYKILPSYPHKIASLMRDSAGFMIDPSGKIVFAVSPLNTVLRTDSIANIYVSNFEMNREPSAFQVPAGSFNDVLNFQHSFSFNSTANKPPNMPQTRLFHNRYAKNIGLIFQSYAYANAPDLHRFERRLVNYQIVP